MAIWSPFEVQSTQHTTYQSVRRLITGYNWQESDDHVCNHSHSPNQKRPFRFLLVPIYNKCSFKEKLRYLTTENKYSGLGQPLTWAFFLRFNVTHVWTFAYVISCLVSTEPKLRLLSRGLVSTGRLDRRWVTYYSTNLTCLQSGIYMVQMTWHSHDASRQGEGEIKE